MIRYLLLSIFLISYFNVFSQSEASSNDTIILEEVTVSAKQRALIMGMLSGNLKLNVEQMKSIPSLTGTVDVLKLIELTPSARTSGDGSSNLYIRGGDAGQNLILYNGVPTYTSGHMLGIFPLFNADHLSWLQVSKSGDNSDYGNFISSVIDVRTKEELPTEVTGKGSVGLLASQMNISVPLSKDWGFHLSGRKTYLELFVQPILENAFDNSEDSDLNYDFWDTNITLVGKIGRIHTLTLDAMLSSDHLKLIDEDILIDGKMNWTNNLASLNLSSMLSDNLNLNQILSYSGFNNKMHTRQEELSIDLRSNIENLSYRNRFSFILSDVFLTTGVGYTYHTVKPHDLEMINSNVVTNSIKEEKIEAHDISPYLSFKKTLDRLTLNGVLRYNLFISEMSESNNSKTFQSVDARVGFQYQLSTNRYGRFNYSHNNQYVNKLTPSSVGLPTDFWVLATSNLRPQRGDEFSFGYYQFLPKLQMEFSIDTYYKTMNNVTQFDYNFIENDNIPFADKISYGKGKAYGVELMVKKNIGPLTGWLSYALSKSERKFSNFNNGSWFPARYDRIHDLSITSNYEFSSKWDVSLSYIFATGNTYTQPTSWFFLNNLPIKDYTKINNARMPNYSRLDLGVNYWFKKDNGLNLSIYNALVKTNPIYVFMAIKQSDDNTIYVEIKKKKIYSLIPSISWNFKF